MKISLCSAIFFLLQCFYQKDSRHEWMLPAKNDVFSGFGGSLVVTDNGVNVRRRDRRRKWRQ